MTKFNTPKTRARGRGPITTTGQTTTTYEGADAFVHDVKSELFLLAVTNFVGEDTFYEKASDRDQRFRALVHQAASEDFNWLARMLEWLRSKANMRSAPLVGAIEAVVSSLALGQSPTPTHRALVASVLQRPDEPGEALAYALSRYGRAVPKPIKRGIADAAQRLYTEHSALKYDTASHGVRFADVIEMCRVKPVDLQQARLFAELLNRRHGRPSPLDALRSNGLAVFAANASLRADLDSPLWINTYALKTAGMAWEDVLSARGSVVDKKVLWEALIPSMGYMALLRNLRNFDEAGISPAASTKVAARLADPDQVAKSRQLPYRFFSAYKFSSGAHWHLPLEQALSHAVTNVPELPGRSLVLIDTSASMSMGGFSARSKLRPVDAAALFGITLGVRNAGRVDVVGFADGVFKHDVRHGASILREMERFSARIGEVGHGTQIAKSVRDAYAGHDRVFVLTDMQTFSGYEPVGASVPSSVPIYGFNIGGYQSTVMNVHDANHHEFGGLTDATFRMIPLIEAGKRADWPF